MLPIIIKVLDNKELLTVKLLPNLLTETSKISLSSIPN